MAEMLRKRAMMRTVAIVPLALAGALASAAPALAADAEEASKTAASTVETVVVTATRREVNIQDVPLSVNAFSGAQLEERHIDNFQDLVRAAPGLNFSQTYRYNTGLTLRGGTTASNSPAVDTGVTIYIDEVPTIGTTELRGDFFDLDRIEILRGPQGTLFGRNVTSGLISMHTSRPSFDRRAKVQLEYGAYNTYAARAYVTGPLSDTLAGKLTFAAFGHDGYAENTVFGGDYGETDTLSGRAQLLYKPDDRLSILIGGDFIRERGDSFTLGLLGSGPQPNTVLPQFPTLSYDPDDVNNGFPGRGKIDSSVEEGELALLG